MTHARLIGTLALAATIAAPLSAVAQHRDRGSRGAVVQRAVPRAQVRGGRPGVIRTYRPFYRGYGYYPFYGPFRPGIDLGFYYGYPGYGGFGWYGYGPGYWPSYGYSGAYPGMGPGYRSYGGVRINLPQRDAEVWVDGYYAGVVDDFDGQFQQLSLEPGVHSIEVRAPGFEVTSFEVQSEPGRTITYRSPLRPQP
jgi:hypothetical protein